MGSTVGEVFEVCYSWGICICITEKDSYYDVLAGGRWLIV